MFCGEAYAYLVRGDSFGGIGFQRVIGCADLVVKLGFDGQVTCRLSRMLSMCISLCGWFVSRLVNCYQVGAFCVGHFFRSRFEHFRSHVIYGDALLQYLLPLGWESSI
ncbi:hypothetical protein LPH50_00760 [Xylella taiwanensis]|uniref:Uncharacterized protein n=1 Tax=Xylella taiwanensis TaxID=1444770 RepID=Z9JH07_9GAMM|nr:hypothetical protein [Xylella taiwanensis]AXI83685.1 hypothetical protein AB672_06940 [Xylella taiwanensis]EWS77007.1 hypothetical protein AF72_13100 [Xylella taiwanensis]MCD8456773.1 hypothetical protein [Xylella taiwanensis]MCD8459183.1 hypothetical protein [Xylella taiwanensis]MCD8461925.1 hypothetical protein [Xylella taiwanensis]